MGDRAIVKIIKAIAILIGFSWEEAFHAGVSELAKLTGTTWRTIVTRLVLAIAIGVIVVPAWRWYILKKTIELEEKYQTDGRLSSKRKPADDGKCKASASSGSGSRSRDLRVSINTCEYQKVPQ